MKKDQLPNLKDHTHPALKDAFGYKLMQVALKYRKSLLVILEEYDLIPPQMAILKILEVEDSLNQAALGEELGFDKVTTNRMIDGLEKQGFVKRVQGKVDKRERLIQITKEGKETILLLKKRNITREKNFLGALSASEAEILKKLIMKL